MPEQPPLNVAPLPGWVPPLDTGKPSAEDLNALPGTQVNDVASSSVAIPLVYGRDRVRGRLIALFVSPGGLLVGAWAFCQGGQGGIDGYEKILIDGIDVEDPERGALLSGVSVTTYLGNQTQNVDEDLRLAAEYLGGFVLTDNYRGTAYAVISVPDGATQGFPRVEAIVRGLRVYDCRLDSTNGGTGAHRFNDPTTWTYSENPTLCFADFITQYAKQEVDWPSIAENADANDEELVAGHPRRRVGLTMTAPATVDQWCKGWRAYMGAFLAREKGVLRVIPERADVPPPWGLQFPGTTGAAVVVGDIAAFDFDAAQSFTIELAFKSGDLLDAQALIAKRGALASGKGWSLGLGVDGALTFTASDGTLTNTQTSPTGFADGDWHLVAVVYDVAGNSIDMYVDGVDVGTNSSFTVSSASNLATTQDLVIGAVGPSRGSAFSGALDEIRIWSTARTPAQLAANLYRELEAPQSEAGLIGYWRCNEFQGATVQDASVTGANGTISGAVARGYGCFLVIPTGVVRHFTADDIIDNTLSLRHRPLVQSPTVVEIEFVDQSSDVWRTDVRIAETPGALAGTEPRRVSRVRMPGIHRPEQALREAIERLNWMLSDLEGSFQCADVGLELQQGSIIALSHPIGLSTKLMRVRRLSGLQGRWTVEVAEYDPRIYSDEVITTPTTPDTLLPDPAVAPGVTALAAEEQLFQYRTGLWGSRIRVTWSAPVGYPYTIQRYLVEWYIDQDGGPTPVRVFQAYVSDSPALSPPVEDYVNDEPVIFQVRVYAETAYGTGTVATVSVPVLGKLLPPGNVPAVRLFQISANAIEIDWDAADDIDIWRYEVRYSVGTEVPSGPGGGALGTEAASPLEVLGTATASPLEVLGTAVTEGGGGSTISYADWDSSTLAALVDGLTTTLRNLPTGRYRIYVKAVDSVRQRSPLATFADITIEPPQPVTALRGIEVGGDIRLSWARSVSRFVIGYRIEWRTSPAGTWTFLEEVDATKTIIPGFQQGTYEFRVLTIDDQRALSAPSTAVIVQVTSDEAAYTRDIHEFTNPTFASNLANWSLELDGTPVQYWVTNMADPFVNTTFQDYATQPLANYHSAGVSVWGSPVHEFVVPLTGTFVLTPEVYSLLGSVAVGLYLSADNVTWVEATALAPSYGSGGPIRLEKQGTYKYAYVEFYTTSTETLFVTVPSVQLKLEAQPYTELGQVTTSISGPTTVTTSRVYGVLRGINTQPINVAAFRTVVVDNIVFTAGATRFDLYAFDSNGDQVVCDVAWSWTGI